MNAKKAAGAYKAAGAKTAGQDAYHHGNLRATLLAHALRVLRRRGAQNLSLRDLARETGVSQAAPYRHFAGKDSLLAELAAQGFRELAGMMRLAIKGARRNPARALQATGVAYVRFAVDHPEQHRLMFGSYRLDRARHPELSLAAAEAYGVLLEAIRRAVGCGDLKDQPEEALATAAWAMVHGLASLIIDRQLATLSKHDATALARQVTGLLHAGIGKRP